MCTVFITLCHHQKSSAQQKMSRNNNGMDASCSFFKKKDFLILCIRLPRSSSPSLVGGRLPFSTRVLASVMDHYGVFSMAVDLQFFPLVCANSSILAHKFPAHNKNRGKKKIWDTSIFEGCVEILKTLFMAF
jgi:hypothetical protein